VTKFTPLRRLLLLGIAFVFGIVWTTSCRFTQPLLNGAVFCAILFLPFLAIRPLLKFPPIPKVFGLVLLSPILLLSLFLILYSVACETSISSHEDAKGGCIFHLGTARQGGDSVDLIRDNCGGVLAGSMVLVEQRKPLFPGFYIYRTLAVFDDAYEGTIETTGADQIRIHIPQGVDANGTHEENIERIYTLKRHLFF